MTSEVNKIYEIGNLLMLLALLQILDEETYNDAYLIFKVILNETFEQSYGYVNDRKII
jgi:hypothetical protein